MHSLLCQNKCLLLWFKNVAKRAGSWHLAREIAYDKENICDEVVNFTTPLAKQRFSDTWNLWMLIKWAKTKHWFIFDWPRKWCDILRPIKKRQARVQMLTSQPTVKQTHPQTIFPRHPEKNTSVAIHLNKPYVFSIFNFHRFGISPQLRVRKSRRDQPREELPRNKWKTRTRSGSLPGQGEYSPEQFMKNKELQSTNDHHIAWNERKSRPKSAKQGSSRITFTEWLDNKKSSQRTRATSARAQSKERRKDDVEHEEHFHSSKSYDDWLIKKDLEVLEQQKKLRRKARVKCHRTKK